jgi:hypothetical protein
VVVVVVVLIVEVVIKAPVPVMEALTQKRKWRGRY